MKKCWLASVGLVALGLSAPASAADLAPITKAPPPVAAVYDWTGFYIGVNGGGGSSYKCWDFIDPGTGLLGQEGCHDASGITAGGQIGYRWGWGGGWVIGIEGQGNWANFSGSNPSALFAPDVNRSRIDAFGLVTGQIGYAWNNVLFYVKGGAAVTSDKYDAFDGFGVPLASANETRWGGTVGAGLEVGFAGNWSVGFEYDHLFMGTRTINLTDATGAFFEAERIRQDVDIGMVRLNYRFGGYGLPVAARY